MKAALEIRKEEQQTVIHSNALTIDSDCDVAIFVDADHVTIDGFRIVHVRKITMKIINLVLKLECFYNRLRRR